MVGVVSHGIQAVVLALHAPIKIATLKLPDYDNRDLLSVNGVCMIGKHASYIAPEICELSL